MAVSPKQLLAIPKDLSVLSACATMSAEFSQRDSPLPTALWTGQKRLHARVATVWLFVATANEMSIISSTGEQEDVYGSKRCHSQFNLMPTAFDDNETWTHWELRIVVTANFFFFSLWSKKGTVNKFVCYSAENCDVIVQEQQMRNYIGRFFHYCLEKLLTFSKQTKGVVVCFFNFHFVMKANYIRNTFYLSCYLEGFLGEMLVKGFL